MTVRLPVVPPAVAVGRRVDGSPAWDALSVRALDDAPPPSGWPRTSPPCSCRATSSRSRAVSAPARRPSRGRFCAPSPATPTSKCRARPSRSASTMRCRGSASPTPTSTASARQASSANSAWKRPSTTAPCSSNGRSLLPADFASARLDIALAMEGAGRRAELSASGDFAARLDRTLVVRDFLEEAGAPARLAQADRGRRLRTRL